jgi:preprotein translocase subunit YajC
MFGLLWLVLIRPQKAKQQQQKLLLNSVEPGDEILTVGGIFGIVQGTDEDDELIVEIAEGVHVRIARKAVATVVKPDTEDDVDEVKAIEERQEEMAREVEAARVGDPVS